MICYATGHPLSNRMMNALSTGLECPVSFPPYKGGDSAVYGVLRGCDEIMDLTRAAGCDYLHVDHGYFFRGLYYRITKNALQYTRNDDSNSKRWDSLGIKPKKWRKTGKNILIIPPSGVQQRYFGVADFLPTTLRKLREVSDRELIVREKSSNVGLVRQLEDAHIVVTYCSNVAVEAILFGVPVITTGPSAAKPVSTPFSSLESPLYPPRRKWASTLANHQFTLEEMRDPALMRRLR